ncbi:myc box-dependent-interacting protein 1-like [Gordionus sp. m RMFG-2023]|uniref:myc box-dependent-interacting protein 1-like n=1 Tax=Gordionus sp. m RMFG-2023 TaxID=3053472 RepID=UPI0031FD6B59
MSNEKKSNFASVVQKGAVRAKEKILVNLGKVDKTKDDLFDDYISNFNKQQLISSKLYKDLKAYINSIKEKSICEKSLYEAIKETYEIEWQNKDLFCHLLDSFDFIWQDYIQKLENQVLIPLNSYNNQFIEIKDKINKRSRKLLYFDSARHSYDTLINSANKKKDDQKINKALDQLTDAKKVYQDLNNELHESLPTLYQTRISFLVSHFQSLFAAELQFHNEMAKVNNELSELMDILAEGLGKNEKWQCFENHESSGKVIDNEENVDDNSSLTKIITNNKIDIHTNIRSSSKNPFDEEPEDQGNIKENDEEKQDLNIQYKVKALYKYTKEDNDELSFEPGDYIYVIDSQQELDSGWKFGIKVETKEKGVFPENHTKQID